MDYQNEKGREENEMPSISIFLCNVCECEYAQMCMTMWQHIHDDDDQWQNQSQENNNKKTMNTNNGRREKTGCEQMKRMNSTHKHTRKHRSAITKNGESLIIHKNN